MLAPTNLQGDDTASGSTLGTASLDATIIRSVILPAVMTLPGERNWYLPSSLGRLPDYPVEGAEAR
jgi:uncharacterized membrane protein YdfJ with MMPL/SSD domain